MSVLRGEKTKDIGERYLKLYQQTPDMSPVFPVFHTVVTWDCSQICYLNTHTRSIFEDLFSQQNTWEQGPGFIPTPYIKWQINWPHSRYVFESKIPELPGLIYLVDTGDWFISVMYTSSISRPNSELSISGVPKTSNIWPLTVPRTSKDDNKIDKNILNKKWISLKTFVLCVAQPQAWVKMKKSHLLTCNFTIIQFYFSTQSLRHKRGRV